MNQTCEQLRDEFEAKRLMSMDMVQVARYFMAYDPAAVLLELKYSCLSSLMEAIYEIRKGQGETAGNTQK